MKSLRVLLIAEDSLVRLGLRTALAGETLNVAGEAAGMLDGIAKALMLQPDIIFLEMGGARLGDLEVVREIAQAALQARIILLTDRDEETFVEQALMYGASAYVLKQTAATDLAWAVKAVKRGREYFSPSLIQHLRAPSATIPEPDQHQALMESAGSLVEARLRKMINQGNLIRQLARELSANIKLLRKHHPELLHGMKGGRLASFLGGKALKRLLAGTPSRSQIVPEAAT